MTPSPLGVQDAVLPKQSLALADRVLVRLVLSGRQTLRPRRSRNTLNPVAKLRKDLVCHSLSCLQLFVSFCTERHDAIFLRECTPG